MSGAGGRTMVTLSAFVCAHNEESRIAGCLERLSFCDEIVVVADRCTDRTEMIARRLGARVVSGIFPLEGDRLAVGAAACSGDWILEIDADETVGPALAREITDLLSRSPPGDWFSLPVDNYIGERLVRFGWEGSFGASAVTRLYRRGVKAWGRERIHPTVRFIGARGESLRNALRRVVDENISGFLLRLDRQSRLRAEDFAERGERMRLRPTLFASLRRLQKSYVANRGFREGEWGLLIAVVAAAYPLISLLHARLESVGASSAPSAKVLVLPTAAARRAMK